MKKTETAFAMAFKPSAAAVSALAGAYLRRDGRTVTNGIWAAETARRGSCAWRTLPV